jgi:hypothetical protein
VENDQKIQQQFYPEFLFKDGSFLPDDSNQHQMHFNQERNHLFHLPTHCYTTVTAQGFITTAQFSGYQLGQLKFPTDSVLHEKLFL